MYLYAILCLLGFVTIQVTGNKFADPLHLDELLKKGHYEEFEKYLGISVAGLSRPENGRALEDPQMNVELFEGDILQTVEQGRQGIRFDRHPTYRWPGDPAVVTYYISRQFSRRDRRMIHNTIIEWNDGIPCVQFLPWRGERNLVYIFPGAGCYALLGRVGGVQPLSLGRGCVHQGIIFHEMEHSIGIHHEHTRYDRDDYVEVLWDNIPPRWHSQYAITNNQSFNLLQNYDYYSVMHYPLNAPETNKPAFRILQDGIDANRMGRGNDFTYTDIQKIVDLYCPAQEQ